MNYRTIKLICPKCEHIYQFETDRKIDETKLQIRCSECKAMMNLDKKNNNIVKSNN